MTDYNRAGDGGCDAIKSDGTPAVNVPGVGVTLTAGTWYLPLGSFDAQAPSRTALVSTQLIWSTLLAGTFTFESCNAPGKINGQPIGPVDVADNDANAAAANWIPEATTVTPQVIGTGNSAAAAPTLSITAGGTGFGGAMVHQPNIGSRRVRVKAVLTNGGTLRVLPRAKLGA